MRKILLLLLVIFLNGCSKKYIRNHTYQVPNTLAQIDLNNYTFYKREIYYKDDYQNENFIKTQTPIDATYARYEIQIMAVESNWNPKNVKNVIYFSYIPPYYFGDSNVYECVAYDNFNLVNLNDINYIQFGKLDKSNKISFIKDKSVSIWDYSLDANNDVTIDNVTFLDRGKIKTEKTNLFLKNKAIFKNISSPDIVLFNYYNQNYNVGNANYLNNNILHYDKATNNFYFEFNGPLKMRRVVDGNEHLVTLPETWVKYDNSRVRANYVE